MKNFSQFVKEASIRTESPRIQWREVPKDGHDIPEIIKTNDPKKPKPKGEGYVECPTCDATGRVVAHTGIVGQNRETGKMEAQYYEQSCRTCHGYGHYKKPPPYVPDFSDRSGFPSYSDRSGY